MNVQLPTTQLTSDQKNAFHVALISCLVAILFSITITVLGINAHTAHAAPVTGFNAGRIIDDAVFTNNTSMSANSIQTFLNSKVPVCDTNGTQTSEFGGGTRAQWGAAHNNPAPFICLKDYSENGKSAAQIIYDISQTYRINPQVLLVLLQKEQGLVTDTWPLNSQYKTATGYGCPDTAPCDTQYFGLTNQLTWSGKMFRAILDNSPTWYTPYVLGQNFIQYSPDGACGGSMVNIENRATQALYNYTPYQPNQGALNAGYGTAQCGAYGNRNFYLYFSEWFGSTTGPAYSWSMSSYGVYADQALTQKINDKNIINLATGQSAYVKIAAQNTGRTTWQQGDLLMGTPNIYSPIRDSSWLSRDRTVRMAEQSVGYGGIGTFIFKITAPSTTSTYYQNFNLVIDGLTWFNNAGPSLQINVSQPIVQPAMSTGNMLRSGQTLKNGESINSPDNNTVLRFEYGQLVLYTNFGRTWNTTVAGSSATSLVNQPDGNLVMYNSDGSVAWTSNTSGNGPSDFQVQNDGNLVLYSANAATWASHSSIYNQQNRINNILANDQIMFTGQRLITTDRGRILVLQNDGNLVLYTPYRVAWASNTAGSGANRMIMQPDGNLVLYTQAGRAVWASNTAGRGASDVLLQTDSNLVIYGSTSTWSTNTAGK